MKIGTLLILAWLAPSTVSGQASLSVEGGRAWLHGWHRGAGHGYTLSLEYEVMPLSALELGCGSEHFEAFRPFRHCAAGLRQYLLKGPVRPFVRIAYGGSATASVLSRRVAMGAGFTVRIVERTSIEIHYSNVEVYTPALHPEFIYLTARLSRQF